nr:4Fe-4S cluster-binding domain-containing protein [Parabacteroides bouchesdurhonensis]
MSVSNLREVMISFYGGEPLLNISFIKKVVEYIEKLHICAFKFSMTTNSILLDKYIWLFLNILTITVSTSWKCC